MPDTIDTLLAIRGVKRVLPPGDPAQARAWLDLSRHLAVNFPAFDAVRLALVHPDRHSHRDLDAPARAMADWLVQRRCVERTASQGIAFPPEVAERIRPFLKGLWLESYVWCAMMAAGADEAYFNQKVEWQLDDTSGINEVDVIARKRDSLVLVSCKAISPAPCNGRATELRQYLFEAHYWNLHFAAGRARAAVVTTADLIDERPEGNTERHPPLRKQAEILGVGLIGGEDLAWNRLVPITRELLRA